MKVFIKNFLFIVFNFLSNFIKVKKFTYNDENIVILLQKPLGLGDLVILSPFVSLIENNFKSKIFILSEYDSFIEFQKVIWLKPKECPENLIQDAIVISPTLAFSHLKYIFKAKYFIGYFISNKLISNFSKISYTYNPKYEHYLLKTFIILDIFKIEYDKNDLFYPAIKYNFLDLGIENYIVLAPYSNWKERQYPFNNYISLISNLIQIYKINIIFIGSNDLNEVAFNQQIENKLNNPLIINLTAKTSILQMNYIIKNSKCFIGNDSGPANIAYLIAKKSIVFFGSVDFENRLPLNSELKLNILALDSRHECKYFPCYDGYNKPDCENLDKYCCISKTFIINKDLEFFLDINLCAE